MQIVRCQTAVRHSQRRIHTLRSAISYCGKGPFSNKDKNPGEDFAIRKTWITPGALQGASFVGVADGVGGWKRHGVDPSHLSRGLMKEMGQMFEYRERRQNKELEGSGALPSCQHLLDKSFAKLYKQGSRYAGGTTVCVGEFNPQKAQIEVLNLGDSGAWLIRDHKVIEKTVPDIQGMTPGQLTVLPAWMEAAKHNSPELEPAKQTASAHNFTWQLQPRDILIFATDGFFDNVSKEETLNVLAELENIKPSVPIHPRELADKLIAYAYANSLNPHIASPFALRCLQEDEFDYWGGKPDDISIIACIVNESDLDIPFGQDPQSKL